MKNRINTDDIDAVWEWDGSKIKEVQEIIDDWIMEYEIFDSESLYQLDNGIIESPTLVAKILEALNIQVEYK